VAFSSCSFSPTCGFPHLHRNKQTNKEEQQSTKPEGKHNNVETQQRGNTRRHGGEFTEPSLTASSREPIMPINGGLVVGLGNTCAARQRKWSTEGSLARDGCRRAAGPFDLLYSGVTGGGARRAARPRPWRTGPRGPPGEREKRAGRRQKELNEAPKKTPIWSCVHTKSVANFSRG